MKDDNRTIFGTRIHYAVKGLNRLVIFRWLITIALSFIFAWAVAFFFDNSLELLVFDQEVNKFILKPNTEIRSRKEGWATSMVGPHGITGLYTRDHEKKSIIAIWGDSHIQGKHVEDSKKAGSVITLKCRHADTCDYVGLNIGLAGQSIADYFYAIPNYENVFDNIVMHYIVLSSMQDVIPDSKSAHHAKFVSTPNLGFERTRYRLKANGIKTILQQLKLDFIWFLAQQIYKLKELRFFPSFGSTKENNCNDEYEQLSNDLTYSWRFLLQEITEITDRPLTFVYLPTVPTIGKGKIETVDSESALSGLFKELCSEYGVDFINLENEFLHFYKQTHRFPHGFANTHPSKGHLNVEGHLILGRTILRHALSFQ